ncbi:TfoX/Sxy family protein [Candidatus Curtissbacteria bacterium]|nr:TfoX/Sxy family protein [Candidatus Curtissbacteria bacterium]
MATKQSTIDFLVDQIAGAGEINSRKMFGEYALYCDTKVVAFVCDDQLFVKPTAKGRALIENLEEKPPYPGAKLYFWISGDLWEDSEWLTSLIRETASDLPLPKKKK